MFETFRNLVRVAMANKQITPADLAQRLAEARAQHAQAVTELNAAESGAAQESLSGSLDELTLARTDKALAKARERVRRWSEQIARLEIAGEELDREAATQRKQALLERIDQNCRAREKLAADLDAWVSGGAALFRQFGEVNTAVLKLLPHSPSDLPQMFNLRNLQNILLARLAAESDGVFLVRGEAHSIDSLKKSATVTDRASEERVRLLSQYMPKPQPTSPEAA